MHEYSLALEVVELVRLESGRQGFTRVSEILIEVGALSGVEADALQWALELIAADTILEGAAVSLARTNGTGKCSKCNTEFEMKNLLDICPDCHGFPSRTEGGKELRVVSMTVE